MAVYSEKFLFALKFNAYLLVAPIPSGVWLHLYHESSMQLPIRLCASLKLATTKREWLLGLGIHIF